MRLVERISIFVSNECARSLSEHSIHEAKGLEARTLPRRCEHVTGRGGRSFERGERGKRLEQKHFRSSAIGDLRKQARHGVDTGGRRGDDWNEEVGKAEVGPMKSLFG